MDIYIRKANADDVQYVHRMVCMLEELELDRGTFEAIYLSNVADERNIYLVAEADNKVVGFLSCHGQQLLHHNGWVYEIQELFTDETYRGKGIGKQLLNELERQLVEKKYDMIDVTSGNRRKEAHAFYMKNGFSQTHQKFTKKGNR